MQPAPVPSQNKEAPQLTLWHPKRRGHTRGCSPCSRSRKGHTCKAHNAPVVVGTMDTRLPPHSGVHLETRGRRPSPIPLEGCTAWFGPLSSFLRFGGGKEGGRLLGRQGEGTEVRSRWGISAENTLKGKDRISPGASLPPTATLQKCSVNTQRFM